MISQERDVRIAGAVLESDKYELRITYHRNLGAGQEINVSHNNAVFELVRWLL